MLKIFFLWMILIFMRPIIFSFKFNLFLNLEIKSFHLTPVIKDRTMGDNFYFPLILSCKIRPLIVGRYWTEDSVDHLLSSSLPDLFWKINKYLLWTLCQIVYCTCKRLVEKIEIIIAQHSYFNYNLLHNFFIQSVVEIDLFCEINI